MVDVVQGMGCARLARNCNLAPALHGRWPRRTQKQNVVRSMIHGLAKGLRQRKARGRAPAPGRAIGRPRDLRCGMNRCISFRGSSIAACSEMQTLISRKFCLSSLPSLFCLFHVPPSIDLRRAVRNRKTERFREPAFSFL